MRLFKAWSVVNNFKGQERVKFNWFVVGREKPVAGNDELIEDYCANDSEAWCDEVMVNELFTAVEIDELKNYLMEKHQMKIQIEEVKLPIKSGGLSYGLLLISGENNFYTLADEDDYNLSVSVLGQFDAKESEIPQSLSPQDMNTGISFFQYAFKNLNISGVEKDELIVLLNQIYTETGMYIHNV